jgi:hypothetical protein
VVSRLTAGPAAALGCLPSTLGTTNAVTLTGHRQSHQPLGTPTIGPDVIRRPARDQTRRAHDTLDSRRPPHVAGMVRRDRAPRRRVETPATPVAPVNAPEAHDELVAARRPLAKPGTNRSGGRPHRGVVATANDDRAPAPPADQERELATGQRDDRVLPRRGAPREVDPAVAMTRGRGEVRVAGVVTGVLASVAGSGEAAQVRVGQGAVAVPSSVDRAKGQSGGTRRVGTRHLLVHRGERPCGAFAISTDPSSHEREEDAGPPSFRHLPTYLAPRPL